MRLQSPQHRPRPADADRGGLRVGLGSRVVSNGLSGDADLAAHGLTAPRVSSRQKTPTPEAQIFPEQNEAFQWLCGGGGAPTSPACAEVMYAARCTFPFLQDEG